MMNPNQPPGTPPSAPGQGLDPRRKWLMGQLASQQSVGAQPGVGRMPTMDEQAAAGQAGKEASPPAPSNPMLPDMGQMGRDMRQQTMAPMMRPNPAPSMPSAFEMSGMGNNRAAGAALPGMMQGGGMPGVQPQQPGAPGQPGRPQMGQRPAGLRRF